MVVINVYSTQNPSIVAATRRYRHIGIPTEILIATITGASVE
jgi:hypothetical protein